MSKKPLLPIFALVITLATSSCDGLGQQAPNWDLVMSGVGSVIKTWYANDVCSDGDDFDIAASAIAMRWQTQEFLRTVRNFAFDQITAKVAKEAIAYLFPASSWEMGVLRDQIAAWTYETTHDFLGGQAKFRAQTISLTVSQINQRPKISGEYCTVLSGDLPKDLAFNDFFLVGYNQNTRAVSVLIVSDHSGKRDQFPGLKQRAWFAQYVVDDNGMPKTKGQTLKRIDLATVLQRIPEILGATPTPKTSGIVKSTPTPMRVVTPTMITGRARTITPAPSQVLPSTEEVGNGKEGEILTFVKRLSDGTIYPSSEKLLEVPFTDFCFLVNFNSSIKAGASGTLQVFSGRYDRWLVYQVLVFTEKGKYPGPGWSPFLLPEDNPGNLFPSQFQILDQKRIVVCPKEGDFPQDSQVVLYLRLSPPLAGGYVDRVFTNSAIRQPRAW